MKIFVTRKIPGAAFEKLKEGHEVVVSPHDRPLAPEELLEGIKGVDGILAILTDKIEAKVMDAAGPQLKVISSYSVGFDNIDLAAASARGIVVCNTSSDEVNEAVAEHTWGLILSLSRRIVEADEFVRKQGYFAQSGGYRGWEPDLFLGRSLIGKTLGIVGLGRIGSMVARRAQGYEMRVLYCKKTRLEPEKEKELGVQFCDLDQLLPQSDFVSLHVPLTEETRGLINKVALSKMKPGSYLVNTARGPVVDESDLIEALKSGQLQGAALDVFESEPNVSPELLGLPNVIMTPHIASATVEAREKMTEQAVSAILSVFSGQKPENLVNPEVWPERRK